MEHNESIRHVMATKLYIYDRRPLLCWSRTANNSTVQVRMRSNRDGLEIEIPS